MEGLRVPRCLSMSSLDTQDISAGRDTTGEKSEAQEVKAAT